VTKFRTTLVNRELGIACGKPFSVSTVSIIDAGDSDLLQLETNIE
jgi:ribosomal protein L30E